MRFHTSRVYPLEWFKGTALLDEIYLDLYVFLPGNLMLLFYVYGKEVYITDYINNSKVVEVLV